MFPLPPWLSASAFFLCCHCRRVAKTVLLPCGLSSEFCGEPAAGWLLRWGRLRRAGNRRVQGASAHGGGVRGGGGAPQHGRSSKMITLITSEFGKTRLVGIKWP